MVCNKKRKLVFIKWKWNHVVFSRAIILSFHPVENYHYHWTKIWTFQTKCLQHILLGGSLRQSIIQQCQWKWLGHICWIPTNLLFSITLCWTPQGKKKQGWLKQTRCKIDLKCKGITLETAYKGTSEMETSSFHLKHQLAKKGLIRKIIKLSCFINNMYPSLYQVKA